MEFRDDMRRHLGPFVTALFRPVEEAFATERDTLWAHEKVAAEDLASFTRCVDLFDGNDPAAVEAARERWRQTQAAGHTLTYWQQTEAGWEKKA